MDGFHYYNMFDTKGIEYIIIIAFLLLLIPFAYFLNKQVKPRKIVKRMMERMNLSHLKIPQGVFFTPNHTWTHLAKSGIASVGVDDLLLHMTGEVSFRNLRHQGETIEKGEAMAELIQDGKKLTVYAPVSGTIIRTNSIFQDGERMRIDDPYTSGWLYKIKPVQWVQDTGNLLLAQSAVDWTRKEVDRIRDFFTRDIKLAGLPGDAVVLQEGGEISEELLSSMPGPVWKEFQEEFLVPR